MKFISIQEFAKMFSVTEKGVYKWIHGGQIKAVKIGRVWRIPQSEIERLSRGIVEKEFDRKGE